jgi:threonine/homoserine/homoserine lactone efflux protein
MSLSANLLKGVVIGFCIAAPVGPIGLLCIRTSITQGRGRGLAAGLGAATADAIYGLVAALGLTTATQLLLAHRSAIQIAGGAFLVFLGIKLAVARPATKAADETKRGSHHGAYATTFLLTMANPATILSFIGIFAGIGITVDRSGSGAAVLLVAGVFFGSAFWWVLLSAGASWLGGKLHPERLRLINILSGVAIGAFGAWQLANVLLQSRLP